MMKKVFLFFAAATLLALGMTSCQKDQTVVKYRATIERTTAKTSVENLNNINASHPVVWESGDEITIFRTRDGQLFTFVTDDNNTDEAVFHLASQGDCSGLHGEAVTAGYPADYFHHQGQLQIPTIQNYKNHNVIKYPMYAVAGSGTDELAFKNLCGILRIKMPKYLTTDLPVAVTKVVVWTNQQISGIFDIQNAASTNPTLWPVSGSDEIIMNFATPINLNGSDYEYIYIYLPAADYTTLAFQFYTTGSENKYLEVKSNQTIAINRSQVHTIDLTHITPAREHWTTPPTPADPNLYSVSANLQVQFQKSNLVCDVDGYYDEQPGQWYCTDDVFERSGNMVFTDQLALSTTADGNNFGIPVMAWWETTGIYVATAPSIRGSFIDWGYALYKQDNQNMTYDQYTQMEDRWRTLTYTEWDYVLNKRPRALELHYFVNIAPESDIDDGLHGLLIFPDGWTKPAGINLNSSTYTEGGNTYYYKNIITYAELAQLIGEDGEYGTFLPTVGYYCGTGVNATNGYIDEVGSYWASDADASGHNFIQFWPYLSQSEYGKFEHKHQSLAQDADPYFNNVRLARSMMKKGADESWTYINTSSKKKRK